MYGHREHRRTVSVFDRSDVYDGQREHRNRRIATARCTLSYDGHREHRNRRIATARCTLSYDGHREHRIRYLSMYVFGRSDIWS